MKIFTVTKKAMRPASNLKRCFYCHQPIGEIHDSKCVLIKKTARVRLIIEYDVNVPNFWNKDDVDFHRNESSWCSNNLIDELKNLDGCLCGTAVFECLNTSNEAMLIE